MSTQPAISDAYTVTTEALCQAAGLTRWSLWNHQNLGNLGKSQRRPGVRGVFWTPSQANKFLKRIGKGPAFGSEEK